MQSRIHSCGLVLGAVIAVLVMAWADAAHAVSFGVKQADGMVCRELFGTPHDHHGRARGNSQDEALALAIKHWSRFTVFEYGSGWGDWEIARRKKVDCEGGRGWYCKVDGQPCKH